MRPFNTFGPRQSPRAVIPTIISQCVANSKNIKLGNLSPTRDLTFVKDTCEGFLEIFGADIFFGEAVNIGMNSEVSINDLAKEILSIMNLNIPIINDNERIRPDKSEVDRLVCDNTKLIKGSSWKPKYDLVKGLVETIEWFQSHGNLNKSEFYHI